MRCSLALSSAPHSGGFCRFCIHLWPHHPVKHHWPVGRWKCLPLFHSPSHFCCLERVYEESQANTEKKKKERQKESLIYLEAGTVAAVKPSRRATTTAATAAFPSLIWRPCKGINNLQYQQVRVCNALERGWKRGWRPRPVLTSLSPLNSQRATQGACKI